MHRKKSSLSTRPGEFNRTDSKLMQANLPEKIILLIRRIRKKHEMCSTVFLLILDQNKIMFESSYFFPRKAKMVKKPSQATDPLRGLSFCNACIIGM
jgi:hypothetical protein